MDYKTLTRTVNQFMKMKDPWDHHGPAVAQLSVKLAERLDKFSPEQLEMIKWGANMHDVGKILQPDAFINQPRRLTAMEYKNMQNHTILGWDFCREMELDEIVCDIVFCHHENWDGTGYPRSLKKENIPIVARLVRIVDVFDSMVSDRAYRMALSRDFTMTYISIQSGILFDPEIVPVFIKLIEEKNINAGS